MRITSNFWVLLESFEDLLADLETSPGFFYARVCEILRGMTGADLVWIGFLEPSGELKPRGFSGKFATYLKGLEINLQKPELANNPAAQAIMKGVPIIEAHIRNLHQPSPWHERAILFGLRSAVAIPLSTRGHIFGTVCCYSTRENFFSLKEVRKMEPFVALASIALKIFESHRRKDQLLRDLENRLRIMERRLYLKELEVQSVEETQIRWLSGLGHEFRTPLTSIIGFSEMLLSEVYGPLNDRQKKYLGYIRESAHELYELLNEMQTFARFKLSREETSPETFNLRELLKSILHLLQNKVTAKKLRIVEDFPKEFKVMGESLKIKMILIHLLSNAIKFAPPGSTITLKASLKKDLQGEEWFCFEIEDEGPGIKPEDLYRVFKPFIQGGELHTEKPEGLGLGLTLSRELVEAQGGNLLALVPPRGGGHFLFFIPQGRAPERKAFEVLALEPRFEVARQMALHFTSEGLRVTFLPQESPLPRILKEERSRFILALDPWHLQPRALKLFKSLEEQDLVVPGLFYRASDRGGLHWAFGVNLICLDRPSFLALERVRYKFSTFFAQPPSAAFISARPHLEGDLKRLASVLDLRIVSDPSENPEVLILDPGVSPSELRRLAENLPPLRPLVIFLSDHYWPQETMGDNLPPEILSREISRLTLNFEPEIGRAGPLA